MIKDIFKDILKHTHALGFVEMVKVSGTDTETTISAMDQDKTVIIQGKLHNPISDFIDATIGLSRMTVIDGLLKFPGFDSDDATVSINKQERNGEDIPVEVEFKSAEGHNAKYRFMIFIKPEKNMPNYPRSICRMRLSISRLPSRTGLSTKKSSNR